ncbi:putative Mannosyltransferase [Phytophthora infestans]|uniref:Putative Mannosyltransferase n=1 Tax=Phytophthora infestans TaxID=4787 RepID=A0A8S9TSS5_PHYIN|nr:putative Mannosyltransferase [Phytophthora infestans]
MGTKNLAADRTAQDTASFRASPAAEAVPRLRCVAWRATGECRPNGPREPHNDKNCSEDIVGGMSGFCEVEGIDTEELFKVMRRYCTSLKSNIKFRCSDALDFIRYREAENTTISQALVPGFSLPNVVENRIGGAPRDGIVMVVYPKLLASAYATVRVLRDVLNCRLPIEIWFHVQEIGEDHLMLAPLRQLANVVGDVSFHPMYNSRAKGFISKVYAIYNSYFNRVLFLDADNVPVRDPSFLFDTSEFKSNGAVFWPDFWHPRRTLFNLHAQSMLWELLDTPFIDIVEQESGQLLVDRTRHAAPLELVYFYAFHEPNFFNKLDVIYGDKDLFRLA